MMMLVDEVEKKVMLVDEVENKMMLVEEEEKKMMLDDEVETLEDDVERKERSRVIQEFQEGRNLDHEAVMTLFHRRSDAVTVISPLLVMPSTLTDRTTVSKSWTNKLT